jgi:tRNA modification GTPase
MGNAVKKGISTVIAGRPNAGKSTLLNALLQEERAIVSEIEGTTRDTIEESIVIEGVQFRLIDTAGLREAADQIEAIGVQKTYEKIEQAGLVLFVFDAARTSAQQLEEDIAPFINQKYGLILIANKTDLLKDQQALHPLSALSAEVPFLKLSAATHEGLQELHDTLIQVSNLKQLGNQQAIVTNSRHYEALVKAHEDLHRVLQGLSGGVTSDFVAMDIRQALYHLGSITGEISTDDLLGNIFGKFCIGK